MVHAVGGSTTQPIFVAGSSELTKTIIVLEPSNPDGMKYLRAGVLGVLYADCEIKQLARAIDAVRNGDCYLSRDLGRALAEQLQRQQGDPVRRDPTRVLTERELQVAHLLAKGHPNRIIAQELAMSQATTKFRVSNILHKLKVQTRAQAASVLTRYTVAVTPVSR
ncbi:LuxR C-terminal-related transcriptional regulator [Pseudonocardia kunmingensis]|uniref:Regulatory LuxR family protein n=1 Tax=Pseudonocardia kunmingensis TaxID=630975 RepID=A0A543DYA7_9PSEU|nr:response regulator transcription factor [Pseudonocardia kunmingensis]TQM14313.1 regulatory LuxR family protein [Pseudonocardia kunmingensis]